MTRQQSALKSGIGTLGYFSAESAETQASGAANVSATAETGTVKASLRNQVVSMLNQIRISMVTVLTLKLVTPKIVAFYLAILRERFWRE